MAGPHLLQELRGQEPCGQTLTQGHEGTKGLETPTGDALLVLADPKMREDPNVPLRLTGTGKGNPEAKPAETAPVVGASGRSLGRRVMAAGTR